MKSNKDAAENPLKVISSGEVLMSPKKVIQRMENIVQKYGRERALKSISFQKAREAWVASVFMLGMGQLTKKTYWIQENAALHDAPDIFSYSYRNPEESHEIGVVREIQPVEVCEYTMHVKEGLSDHIKRKLKDKVYHEETILICYIQRPGESFRIIDAIKGLEGLQTTVREVWILFTVENKPLSNFTIARLYLRNMNYPEMLKAMWVIIWSCAKFHNLIFYEIVEELKKLLSGNLPESWWLFLCQTTKEKN